MVGEEEAGGARAGPAFGGGEFAERVMQLEAGDEAAVARPYAHRVAAHAVLAADLQLLAAGQRAVAAVLVVQAGLRRPARRQGLDATHEGAPERVVAALEALGAAGAEGIGGDPVALVVGRLVLDAKVAVHGLGLLQRYAADPVARLAALAAEHQVGARALARCTGWRSAMMVPVGGR